ncbi:TRAP transporter small permease subunit [Engelhardtia mirabilis]|uniref:Tripartite ATP-independent periplasmic transporter, DctQ component n=1 Tax=Engelhardtia mirabilis TaxID=2528011 RepID=A0A518BEY8_9BACT|nr:Tripartite ATP-independent periplasmic transporter, DctQ component [Planctomycetes bacterium Pla133]QDU99852.1 Tripartite ATP-independent periplasmic transporter, DctQ component [Planctomycetes bacterium Pla86]
MDGLLSAAGLVDALNRRVGGFVAWLTALMVAVGAFNALARYTGRFVDLQLSSNAWIELQWYLFSLVFLLGAPWALRSGAHVRVDVLYGRLGVRGKAWIDLVGTLLFLVPFCVFALWASWPAVRESIAVGEVSPDPGGLPRWPIKAVVLLAFALLLLQGLSEAVKRVAVLAGRSPQEVGLEELDPTATEPGGVEGGR